MCSGHNCHGFFVVRCAEAMHFFTCESCCADAPHSFHPLITLGPQFVQTFSVAIAAFSLEERADVGGFKGQQFLAVAFFVSTSSMLARFNTRIFLTAFFRTCHGTKSRWCVHHQILVCDTTPLKPHKSTWARISKPDLSPQGCMI